MKIFGKKSIKIFVLMHFFFLDEMCVDYKISDNTENTSYWTVQTDNGVSINMYACILK